MAARSRAQLARVLDKSLGDLTTAALTTMERDLPWFRELEAEPRSWIGSVAHGGIANFADWLRTAGPATEVTSDVFGLAPRDLTRVVSLQQTVSMLRTTIEVVESKVDDIFESDDAEAVRTAISWYAREVAFAAADVYARAAEARGAWDARLEALIVDSVLRGETDEVVGSRAAAAGWRSSGQVAVVMGQAPATTPSSGASNVIEAVHRAARAHGLGALCSVHGDRLVVILGEVDDLDKAATSIADQFGPGPVVIGPAVPDLPSAHRSARSATAALRAANGWAVAPRPVQADDLLVERSLSGDGHARHSLVHDVYLHLAGQDLTVLTTLASYLEVGSSIEATSRQSFVHVNTVRNRLRRAHEITGLDPLDARDAYTLRVAITLGRLLAPRPDDDPQL